ncbi:MAG: hypothetical protein NC311_03750 [Muribaculaceae bacterium]|nr:hypothetical protein [Muribaculaceae bacterium]
MFTKIVQKWNLFKADWREYLRLRRVASRAWHKLDEIRGKITVLYHPDERANIKRCIKTKFMDIPVLGNDDSFGQKGINVIAYDSYCPNFNGGNSAEVAVPCTETSCPCHANNCEYVAAAVEYKDAVARRRAFWGDNSKSKAK